MGHSQRLSTGHRLDVETPQDARNGDEERILREMDALAQASPEAVVKVIPFHVAGRESGGVGVGVIVEEASGVEDVGVAGVAVWVPVEGHEVGHVDGAFGSEMVIVECVCCEAVGDVG